MSRCRVSANHPQSVPALQKKVALLLARDQAPEAVSLAETALRLDAKSAALQAALGDAQRSFGDLPKAIAAYRKAVGLNAGWAPGWTRLGESLAEALLAARRPAEARRHAEEARRRGRDVRALLQQIARAEIP